VTHENAHAVAAKTGFPYIRGEGKASGGTWMSRFQQSDSAAYPALYVGWDAQKGVWVVEHEAGPPPGRD